jgi:D-sedoheptulose 7-phosphate isomerase
MSTVTTSILRKVRESTELAEQFFESCAPALERTVGVLADRFRRGGRLYVMGNGGSACDAQHLAVEFQHPIVEKRRALPAVALGTETALLTAIGNDTDFSRVFVTELELIARPGDIALGISTSGTAANVVRAVRRARELGLYTIGFAGRDGGQLADVCEVAFVVPTWSVHRIQEVHTMLLHLIWDHVQIALGEPDVL